MPANTFGEMFRVTTAGESHGPGIIAVIDGCPAGLPLPLECIQRALDARRPGQSHLTTSRNESDVVSILSGVFEGKTTGTPITLLIRNTDARSKDYSSIKTTYRPSHADYTYHQKYGHVDYRGGGRASARETAARVAAGAVANAWLALQGITVLACVKQVANVVAQYDVTDITVEMIESTPVRCPSSVDAPKMIAAIEAAKAAQDSVGGVIQGIVLGMPVGVGEPVFDKLPAVLAHAMMSINAARGFEMGVGFGSTVMRGSAHNDAMLTDQSGQCRMMKNDAGGVNGGISNGEPVVFQVAFKPVSTIAQPQQTINHDGESVTLTMQGRHDPCVLPRAVPIVSAMTAIVIMDLMLRARATKND